MTRSVLLSTSAAVAFLLVGAPADAQPPSSTTQVAEPSRPARNGYYCILHPELTGAVPGLCPRCGNPFVYGDPWEQAEYLIDLRTDPASPRAGVPIEIRVTVLEARDRRAVVDFNVFQDRRLHLVVVGQDLSGFSHLHPEQRADGSWSVTHTLARPGYYRAFVRFSPYGGLPQVLARTFATRGYDGDLQSSTTRLVPDRTREMRAGDARVGLVLEPATLRAGPTSQLRYEFTAPGGPATDLEPYDGGWGQVVVLSEDGLDFVRADPVEGVPSDVTEPRGGPFLRFDVAFPRPGRYRTWLQFKRRGMIWTAPFTVEALPLRGTEPGASGSRP